MKKTWLLIAAVLAVAGITAIVSVTSAQRSASRSDEWTQKRAVVERVDGGNVTYRYEMGGATHRGTGPARRGAIYNTGGPVLVYVNPENAAESLLDLPPRPPAWPAVAGGVALLFALALAGWAFLQGGGKSPGPTQKPRDFSGTGTNTRTRRPGTAAKPAKPLARLQPPPPVKWKRGDEGTPSPAPLPPSPPDAPSGTPDR
jgi:Protein of unknown function (DUF3592)